MPALTLSTFFPCAAVMCPGIIGTILGPALLSRGFETRCAWRGPHGPLHAQDRRPCLRLPATRPAAFARAGTCPPPLPDNEHVHCCRSVATSMSPAAARQQRACPPGRPRNGHSGPMSIPGLGRRACPPQTTPDEGARPERRTRPHALRRGGPADQARPPGHAGPGGRRGIRADPSGPSGIRTPGRAAGPCQHPSPPTVPHPARFPRRGPSSAHEAAVRGRRP